MKVPKFAWAMARTLGLGGVVLLSAAAEKSGAEACVTCHAVYPPGDMYCGGNTRGGFYCLIGYDEGGYTCEAIGSCGS